MISTTSNSAETSTLGMYYPAVSVKQLGPLLVATDRTEVSSSALRACIRKLHGQHGRGSQRWLVRTTGRYTSCRFADASQCSLVPGATSPSPPAATA